MDRQELLRIARRLLDHRAAGTTDSEPRGPIRVPASTYTDSTLFERERSEIFGRAPQLVCFGSDLPERGSYLTHDLIGLPILLWRGEDGRVRAFLNVCTHRGARLLDGRGHAEQGISCPYHAWRFDPQGRLAGVNAPATFGRVDAERHALRALACEERHGLVFVRPDGEPLDLDAHLGNLGDQLSFFALERCEPVARGRFEVRANWKLSLDTFSEGYHFATLHRDTLARDTLSNLATHDRYGAQGEHHRLGYAARTLAELTEKPESDWGDPYQHFGLVYFVYPNVSMLISARYVDVFRIFPGASVGEQVTLYDLYSREPLRGQGDREEAEAYFRFTYDVVEREDFHVTESEQHNLECGALDHLTFGQNEPALIHLHRVFRRALGEASG